MKDLDHETASFRYRESLYGSAIWRLLARSGDWDRWDNIVVDNATQDLRLRWKVESTSGVVESGWRRVRAARLRIRYHPVGVEVLVHGTCAGSILGERCHTNAFVNKTVAEMVQTIADQNEMPARIRGTSGKRTDFQGSMPDGQFIRQKLLPMAIDKGGISGYYFWIENGERLVFEPIQSAGANSIGTFALQAPTDEIGARAIQQLDVRFDRLGDPYRGCGVMDAWGFDVLNKQSARWRADDGSVPYLKMAPAVPKPAKVPSLVEPMAFPEIGENVPGSLKEHAMGHWSVGAQNLFRTDLRIPVNPKAKPGQFVNLIVQNPKGEKHFSSGTWLGYAVELNAAQTPEGRAAETRLYLERRNWYA